jgi:anti-sigma factor RsiW
MPGALHRLRFASDHRWVPLHASAYLDGDLAPRDVARVARHVSDCAECRELLHSLQAIVSTLESMRGEGDEPVAAAVFAAVKTTLGQSPPSGG